jgi:CTP synthase
VKELRSIGIQPDILLCRADREIPISERRKIALFCNIREDAVIQALDVGSIYEVPKRYSEQGFDRQVLKCFGIEDKGAPNLSKWDDILSRIQHPSGEVTIAIVGKYTGIGDAYKSLSEALDHAGIANQARVHIRWVDAAGFENQDVAKALGDVDAVLVPGGFGERGVNGKLAAITYARENNKPYLGICFGMQLATIEFARNVLGIKNAASTEFGPYQEADDRGPLVGLMTEWLRGNVLETRKHDGDMGGTMRLGAYECNLAAGSLASEIYSSEHIAERHRHRYEVNIQYRDVFEKADMLFSGMSPGGNLPEIIEYKKHPWFVGVQFHPELKSRPFAPHPLFASFVKAALNNGLKQKKEAA